MITITDGDLTQVETDAIVTCVNSERMWFGGIDGAIMRVAGPRYHSGIPKTALVDGDVHIVRGDEIDHKGAFNHVVFIIDDLKLPTETLVNRALAAAEENRLDSIAFAALRTGVMRDAVEPLAETVAQMVKVFKSYTGNMNINVVIYRDPALSQMFADAINS